MNTLLPCGTVRRLVPAPGWLIVIGYAAFAALYIFQYRHDLLYQWMEDLHVYARAIHFFRGGNSPYRLKLFEGLRFVYPPVVLYSGRALAVVFPGRSEWGVFAFVHLTSVLLAPLVLARYYLREHWLTPGLAILVFLGESRFTGMQALYSANIAPTLYLVGLLTAVSGIRSNRWNWFYAAVFVAGTVKVTFILLLLFPLFAGRRQWLRSAACTVAVGAIYVTQIRFVPSLYAGYKWAVLQQVKVEHQYGYGVFGVVGALDEKLHRPLGFEAYGLHTLVAAVLLAFLFWLRRRGADARDPSVWLGLLVMTVIVVNPRMLHYDAYLALFAAYVVLAVVFALDRWKLVALIAVLYAPSLVVPHFVHTKLMHGSYELCIILFALGAGIWHLAKSVPADGTARVNQAEASAVHAV